MYAYYCNKIGRRNKMNRLIFFFTISLFFLSGSALAQDSIDFEALSTGSAIEGPGAVNPDLDINALNGTATVIEAGVLTGKFGVYSAKNCGYAISEKLCPGIPRGYFHPHNCLEDANGNRVDNSPYSGDPTKTAKGFAAIQEGVEEVQQDFDFTFGNDTSVCEFSLRMFDFGDYNPNKARTHSVTVSGYDSTGGLIDTDTLSYQSAAVVIPLKSFNPNYGTLFFTGDACTAAFGQPGYRGYKVEGSGISKVELRVSGGDPRTALDSIRFCRDSDRITYTWQIDKTSDSAEITLAPGQTYQMPYTVTVTPAIAGDCCEANPLDECINVSDTYAGALGLVCTNGLSFTYTRILGPYEACGTYTVQNTASFVAIDTATQGSDSQSVTVTVPCGPGCTLTQGYWKTHSKYGPAPYDSTWALVGEDTLFFLSGQPWIQVLQTPPAGGNAYYILAHQYIAAKLNVLNGASTTPEVNTALSWAENFFATYTPTSALSEEVRNTAISHAGILDQYNNGLIGPGHCSE
jgi:hypothetical protein